MANEEQLEILKKGVEVWNQWRRENHDIKIDLRNAILTKVDLLGINLSEAILFEIDLREANLRKADLNRAKLINAKLDGVNLERANLEEAVLNGASLNKANLSAAKLFDVKLTQAKLQETNFQEAKLNGASLSEADLKCAMLKGANLSKADLTGVNLTGANLLQANLEEVNLVRTDLSESNLREANFLRADLSNAVLFGADLQYSDVSEANLTGANLIQANFTYAKFGYTILGSNDLSDTEGLETVEHYGPSVIGIDTIQLSNGNIPIEFLIGCGLFDLDIEYAKLYKLDLSNEEINEIIYKIYDIRAQQSIQISPLFISYSHTDSAFVDKIEEYLNAKGIRFWRDVHHAIAGRLEKQIDRAIRHNPTVLVILSENSINSDWVQHEVRTVCELEKETGRDVLCPVALDDSWKDSPWPKRVMEQVMEYNILDFSGWKDDTEFEKLFKKLIDGLELFYK